jgi:hypothetical protein
VSPGLLLLDGTTRSREVRQGVPDVDEVLFGVLAENVGRYLDDVERLAR